jgi:hypothetical protein
VGRCHVLGGTQRFGMSVWTKCNACWCCVLLWTGSAAEVSDAAVSCMLYAAALPCLSDGDLLYKDDMRAAAADTNASKMLPLLQRLLWVLSCLSDDDRVYKDDMRAAATDSSMMHICCRCCMYLCCSGCCGCCPA